MKKKILNLTLKKKWFDLIKSSSKCVEYREYKPYWIKRIEGKHFDEIYFRNGYRKDSPFMRVEYKGYHLDIFEGKKCFALHLGKILEISVNSSQG